jgi:hypothetical protein
LQFDGEFHGAGSKPSNWIRTQPYMMSWFERWTRTPSGEPVDAEKGDKPASDADGS